MEKHIEIRRHHISRSNELLACVQYEQEMLEVGLVENLVTGMRSSCQDVVAAKDGDASY